MDTLALFLPFLKCVYCNNPLSTLTKHIIMLQYFYQASQNRNNLFLQQLNIVLIAFDYLNQYNSYIIYTLILIGLIMQLYFRNIKIILYYISLLALYEPLKAFNLLTYWILIKDTKYKNIATYLFLNILFLK